jgi:hypothetical protein
MSKPDESPNLDDSAKSPIRLFRFVPDILDLIVDVVAPGSPAPKTLKQEVDALFSDHWQLMTWSDLKVFTSGDVASYGFASRYWRSFGVVPPGHCSEVGLRSRLRPVRFFDAGHDNGRHCVVCEALRSSSRRIWFSGL